MSEHSNYRKPSKKAGNPNRYQTLKPRYEYIIAIERAYLPIMRETGNDIVLSREFILNNTEIKRGTFDNNFLDLNADFLKWAKKYAADGIVDLANKLITYDNVIKEKTGDYMEPWEILSNWIDWFAKNNIEAEFCLRYFRKDFWGQALTPLALHFLSFPYSYNDEQRSKTVAKLIALWLVDLEDWMCSSFSEDGKKQTVNSMIESLNSIKYSI